MKLRDAQIAYDNQEPPEQWDCERDGHQWHTIRERHGYRLLRCVKCGAETVEDAE